MNSVFNITRSLCRHAHYQFFFLFTSLLVGWMVELISMSALLKFNLVCQFQCHLHTRTRTYTRIYTHAVQQFKARHNPRMHMLANVYFLSGVYSRSSYWAFCAQVNILYRCVGESIQLKVIAKNRNELSPHLFSHTWRTEQNG